MNKYRVVKTGVVFLAGIIAVSCGIESLLLLLSSGLLNQLGFKVLIV